MSNLPSILINGEIAGIRKLAPLFMAIATLYVICLPVSYSLFVLL
jgi:hypothetical protein